MYALCLNLRLKTQHFKADITPEWSLLSCAFSSWAELLTGVLQGSVLGPLLFNTYLNDLFCAVENSEICNFADDTTPRSSEYILKDLMIDIENDCCLLID